MGIPVPGETALIAAALLAHDGQMSIVPLVAIAAAAAIVGDNVGFAIGRHGGRKLFLRPGPFYDQRLQVIELRRAVLREARAEGGLPRPLGRRAADRVGVAGGDEQDELADLPVLERARRDLLGGLDRLRGLRARRTWPSGSSRWPGRWPRELTVIGIVVFIVWRRQVRKQYRARP